MIDQGYITQEQYDQVINDDVYSRNSGCPDAE